MAVVVGVFLCMKEGLSHVLYAQGVLDAEHKQVLHAKQTTIRSSINVSDNVAATTIIMNIFRKYQRLVAVV